MVDECAPLAAHVLEPCSGAGLEGKADRNEPTEGVTCPFGYFVQGPPLLPPADRGGRGFSLPEAQ